MKVFYLPSVPDKSDSRRSQFQHRANACSQLFEALKPAGHSRSDIRIALEHIRYLSFIESTNNWIAAGASPAPQKTPPPLTFDVRSRAYAKEAFRGLLRHLRIPHIIPEHGTITPYLSPTLGFAFKVTSQGKTQTFLAALPNGQLLAPMTSDPVVLSRGLCSPNRQLLNILKAQAPACLEVALTPRPVDYVGSKRISLFCRNDETSPPNYLYLPPSIDEKALIPRVDGHAILRGEQRIQLVGTSSKKVVAVVSLLPGEPPTTRVRLAKHVAPSPFTRFKPLAAYLRGASDVDPSPITIALNRQEKTPAYTQQRVLLGRQMTAPAWYPLRDLDVRTVTSSDGKRHVGLFPVGVSPLTNPPMKAFTLTSSEVAWRPMPVSEVWNEAVKKADTLKRADELSTLLRGLLGSNSTLSRDAWVTLNELAESDPLVTSLLLFSDSWSSLYSLSSMRSSLIGVPRLFEEDSDGNKAIAPLRSLVAKAESELAGWEHFRRKLDSELLVHQAQSVPLVARLLATLRGEPSAPVTAALMSLSDRSWITVDAPATLLKRLSTDAPLQLESTLRHIKNSPFKPLAALVTEGDGRALLEYLSSETRR